MLVCNLRNPNDDDGDDDGAANDCTSLSIRCRKSIFFDDARTNGSHCKRDACEELI